MVIVGDGKEAITCKGHADQAIADADNGRVRNLGS